MSALPANASPSAPRSKTSVTTGKGRERVNEILQAGRAMLAADGYAGLSMRKIAAALGMSVSNLQHYYRSKDALVEALLLFTMAQFQAKIDRIASETAQASRLQRFVSTIDMFVDELRDPLTHAVFFEIWALASRHAFASALMARMLAREQRVVVGLIAGLNPALSEQETRERATLIVAQVEGLMLFRFGQAEGAEQVERIRQAVRRAVLLLATAD